MKANELRIGNFVYFLGNVHEIEGLSKRLRPDVGHFQLSNMEYSQKGFHLKPIPLTEEWLVKFGFEMHENAPWVLQKQPLMCNIGNRFTWHYKTLSIKDIKYVHQLQNLYFALTGEELTIK